MTRRDPHSYADDAQPETEHLHWRAHVDFFTSTLSGEARLTFRAPAPGGPIDLDTRDLAIEAVSDGSGLPLPFELAPPEPILGSRLRVELPAGARSVTIRYCTSSKASALQWLEPAQTSGGRDPFLFSQCQELHARSVVPIQDTPRLRIRYHAELMVPSRLRGLMAAAHVSRTELGAHALEVWEMPQPISPYLLALAVGNLESRDLGPRTRVWAEPRVVADAAREFADVEAMVATAESLFGRYDWDRFDILTMPPSFPYGGMENPRLVFLTPTLLAGDRSLVNALAHELAHAWTGNLIGSANAEHFWLNEGWTMYAERRIIEALAGHDVAALQEAIGRRDLENDIAGFATRPELTKLRTHLQGIDPDEAFSTVPYEKGYLFLRTLEEAVGRDAFSAFLRKYIDAFRWQTLTSEVFADFIRRELPLAAEHVDMAAWIEGTGIPAGAPAASSARLDAVRALTAKGGLPEKDAVRRWTPLEWQLYLESLSRPATVAFCEALDDQFHLTASRNYEVVVSWLVVAAYAGFDRVLPRAQEVLGRVGRLKFLKPLYGALAARPETRATAIQWFEANEASYHPIAQNVIRSLLEIPA